MPGLVHGAGNASQVIIITTNPYYVPGTVLDTAHRLAHLILTIPQIAGISLSL